MKHQQEIQKAKSHEKQVHSAALLEKDDNIFWADRLNVCKCAL